MDLAAHTDTVQGCNGRVVIQAPEMPKCGKVPARATGHPHRGCSGSGWCWRWAAPPNHCSCRLPRQMLPPTFLLFILNLSFIFSQSSKSKVCMFISCNTLALAAGLHPSVAPNIKEVLQSRNSLSNTLPSPRWHEYMYLPGWFFPSSTIPPVCHSLPVTLAPGQLWDEMLCSVVGVPNCPHPRTPQPCSYHEAITCPWGGKRLKGCWKQGGKMHLAHALISTRRGDKQRWMRWSEKQHWRPPTLLSGAPKDTEAGSGQGMELSTGVFGQGIASQRGKLGFHPISWEGCEFLVLWRFVFSFHLVHLQL